jgi:hypothetical protein
LNRIRNVSDDYLRSLLASENGAAEAPAETQPEPNWGMLEVMRRIAERNRGKPLTSGADTLKNFARSQSRSDVWL